MWKQVVVWYGKTALKLATLPSSTHFHASVLIIYYIRALAFMYKYLYFTVLGVISAWCDSAVTISKLNGHSGGLDMVQE